MPIRVIETPIFPENPNNPARAYIKQNLIEINSSAFNRLPKHSQDYVMRHERGHIELGTLNERLADAYAIETGNRKVKNSLIKDYATIEKLSGNDTDRLESAEAKLTLLSAKRGNKHAKAYLGQSANATGKIDGNGIFILTFYAIVLAAGFLSILL